MIEPGMVIAITTYGVLGIEDIARKGLEAFMGMVGQIHIDCSHWWCHQQDRDVLLMVEFYYSSDEAQNFIGGYLCPGTPSPQGSITFADPVQKILIQPLSDGNHVAITIGRIKQSKVQDQDVGRGPIDRETAEVLMLIPPRPLPAIPSDIAGADFCPRFIVQRSNSRWNLVRVLHDDHETPVSYERFASLPIENQRVKIVIKGKGDC